MKYEFDHSSVCRDTHKDDITYGSCDVIKDLLPKKVSEARFALFGHVKNGGGGRGENRIDTSLCLENDAPSSISSSYHGI